MNESTDELHEQLTICNPVVDPANVLIGGELAPDGMWHVSVAADRSLRSDETYTLVRLRSSTSDECEEIRRHRRAAGLGDLNDDGVDVTSYVVEITTNTDSDGKVVPLDIDEWTTYAAGVQQPES